MRRQTAPDGDPIAEARRQWIAHGWEEAADGMTAVTSIMRAHELLMARIGRTLKPFDLNFARYELLMLLSFARSHRMPMTSAARRLQVHQTSVTNTVDRLVASGFVRREPHPTDGRGTLVVLSDAGADVALRATDVLNREIFTARGTSPTDDVELIAIISRLRKSAGDDVDASLLPHDGEEGSSGA